MLHTSCHCCLRRWRCECPLSTVGGQGWLGKRVQIVAWTEAVVLVHVVSIVPLDLIIKIERH